MSATTSPPSSPPVPTAQRTNSLESATEALSELRVSLDEPPTPSKQTEASTSTSAAVNGIQHGRQPSAADYGRLEADLADARAEKEALELKYSGLVDRVTTLRKTLGDKLKQDAESLKQREEEIAQLNADGDDLRATVDTLQNELLAAHEDAEQSARELERIRARAHEESAAEAFVRERELRETQAELERCRMDRDEWERTAMEERVRAEEARNAMNVMKRDAELEREGRERDADELEREVEKAANLQSVLEDFQSVKEHEIRQIKADYDARLNATTQQLAEFKSRALTAEVALEDSTSSSRRTLDLETELKEKNALIGKLRYDSVVLNEHLTEALRRLRKSSNESNVDRRLVTNVLLSFLTTPRADGKRFEMLALLASILSWSDSDREKAGLQRQGASSAIPLRAATKVAEPAASVDETESFSRMWVEFLLKEAAQGGTATMPVGDPLSGLSSSPNSPRRMAVPLGPHRQASSGRLSMSSGSGTPSLSTFALPPQRPFSSTSSVASASVTSGTASRDSSPTRR
ncbi:hypothetical protein BKA62DRAFT_750759 [Auriculariales sp. MPI-PUGE-AT-0066]|nr:hypothetical protein BKA62DRAFT_750759 [Auriculariales sp. MPI-PUGE-AT-0066]